jgi:hypothetical protein
LGVARHAAAKRSNPSVEHAHARRAVLTGQAKRHDPHELTFIQTFSEQMAALAPAIDRNPK